MPGEPRPLWRGAAPGTTGNQSSGAGALEDRETVEQAMAALAPQDQLALRLQAAGYSYAEIPPIIGVRAGSLGTILARATKRLRQRLGIAVALPAKGVQTP